MKQIAIFILLLGVQAAASPRPGLQTCRLMIVDDVFKDSSYEVTYDIPEVATDGHGGEPVDIEAPPHRIEVGADGRWRNLTWYKNDTLIAKVITLTEKIYEAEHVVILANPQDDNEQLSLGCMPKR